MTSVDKPRILDPKDLLPVGQGFAIGLGILAFFLGLAKLVGLTLLVNHGNIPHQ